MSRIRRLAGLDNRLVTITLEPTAMTCSIIHSSPNSDMLTLDAYSRFELNNLELDKLIFFNPTMLKQHLAQFLKEHNAQHAFVACSFKSPELFERFTTLNTPTPQKDDFIMPELSSMTWHHYYLYPTDNRQWMFYVVGLPSEIIFQCTLLTIAAQLHLTVITTQSMSLFTLYRHLYGKAFRHAQLAVDMAQHNHKPEHMFSKESLHRILHIPNKCNIDLSQEARHLLSACGLFVTERALS